MNSGGFPRFQGLTALNHSQFLNREGERAQKNGEIATFRDPDVKTPTRGGRLVIVDGDDVKPFLEDVGPLKAEVESSWSVPQEKEDALKQKYREWLAKFPPALSIPDHLKRYVSGN